MSEIAIASVAMQEWEKPCEMAEVLSAGSIFPSLRRLFFIEEQMRAPGVMPLRNWHTWRLSA